MNVGITALEWAVPDKVLGRDELVEKFENEEIVDKIIESSNIYERRVTERQECASDLAVKAAEKLFERFNIDKESIDLLLFASQTPDYLIPTTACIIQDRLGLQTRLGAFDINLGCSQYLYSLSTAYAYIKSGLAKRALVLTGDTVTKIINPKDRGVVPLFGDAASATIVEQVDQGGFVDFELGTDGSGHKHLIWPASGMRNFYQTDEEKNLEKIDKKSGSITTDSNMSMNGGAIFVFTMRVVPKVIGNLFEKLKISVDDIDCFVFHQASKLIVDTISSKIKAPPEKVHHRLSDLGNSGGTTVAITLFDAIQNGKIKAGNKVLLTAFGVGLSWGASVIEVNEELISAIKN